jgi:hypothetical protein
MRVFLSQRVNCVKYEHRIINVVGIDDTDVHLIVVVVTIVVAIVAAAAAAVVLLRLHLANALNVDI